MDFTVLFTEQDHPTEKDKEKERKKERKKMNTRRTEAGGTEGEEAEEEEDGPRRT